MEHDRTLNKIAKYKEAELKKNAHTEQHAWYSCEHFLLPNEFSTQLFKIYIYFGECSVDTLPVMCVVRLLKVTV